MKSVLNLSQKQFLSQETIESSAEQFKHHGALQIKGAMNPALLQQSQQHFDQLYLKPGKTRLKRRSSEVYNDRFLTAIKIEDTFNNPELYAPIKVLPILRAILGEDMVLHAFGAITALPGAPLQPIHKDHRPLFPETSTLDAFFPPYAIHLSIPLIDLNDQTGTTALWEGSHRKAVPYFDELVKLNYDRPLRGAATPYTKLGDCLITDFRLYHRGMANLTQEPRSFLYMVFCRRWFYDSTNYHGKQRLLITHAEFKKVPSQHRALFCQFKRL